MGNRKANTLEDYIKELYREKKRKNKYTILSNIYTQINEGKIRLIDPKPPKAFEEYLIRLDYSLWFWSVLAIVAFLGLLILVSSPFLNCLRYVLGMIYVFFLPGFVSLEVLYPQPTEITSLERLVLSIGLSIAIVPPLGLILNFSPFNLEQTPVFVLLSIYIVIFDIVAAYRKFKSLPKANL